MINDLLSKLGLTDKEIEVYLAVLQQGKINPAALAKITGLNRTTIYSVSKELLAKGLIIEDLGGPTINLIAKPPSELQAMIEREESEIRHKKELAKRAVTELQSVVKSHQFALPKIIFVPENEIESYMYKRSDVWNRSINSRVGIWWGFQDATFVQNYEKWIDWYWENSRPEITRLCLLSNESAEKIKTKKFSKRQIQFWDQTENFTATTWINGDYMVMIITNQKPYYLIEIHDAVLAHNQREIFKGIWNTIKNTQA